jgi:myo-inositol-1(or 4)-monophosphatase
MSDLQTYLSAAREAAREAGRFLRQSLDESQEIYYKGALDLVTEADRRSQEMIFARLSASFPEHDFLAEEGLCRNRGSEFRWIFDPLDGTTNFAHRLPIFSVSIGLERRGEVVCGVVYDPMREEMFSAAKGLGATINGKKIKVSAMGELGKSLLATGFPYDIRVSRINNLDHFANFCLRAQAVRRCGSAALDLCYVACGRFDGFWELKLKPWDVAAGALILREAGGRATDFQGKESGAFEGEVLGTNDLIHEEMREVIRLGLSEKR